MSPQKTRTSCTLTVFIWLLMTPAPSAVPLLRVSGFQEGSDAEAHNAKGLSLYNSGKYQEAVESYKQAIKLRKDYPEAHYNLGDAFFLLGQFKKATESYKQAIRLKPGWAVAYNNMGTAFYKLGEHKKAIEALKEAIRLNPKSAMTYYNLGAAYLDRGDEKSALEQYKTLKTVDAGVADRLYRLIYKPAATVFDAAGLEGVRLNVAVTDRRGLRVSNLRQEDFRVFEDGLPQPISYFSKEEVPLLYAIVFDGSGTFVNEIDQAVEASKSIVEGHGAGDEAMVVRFISSDEIKIMEDFTTDKAALGEALEDMFVEAGQTALLDAVYLSAQRVAQYKATDDTYRRRAVILITDGEERSSYYNLDDSIRLLRQIDVQVFAICVNKESEKGDKLNEKLPKGSADLLTRLAKETGGQAFFPETVSELNGIAGRMINMLRTQYIIGYKPVKGEAAGSYRRVTVSLAGVTGPDSRSVVARAGYVIPDKH